MSLGRRIFYNTLAQSLGKIFAVILGLITIGFLSRYLQEQGFGEYATVIAFLGFWSVIADFGLYLYVVREISKPDTNHQKIISNALGFRLTTALVFLFLGAAIAWLLPYDPIVKKTMFIGIGAFLFVSLNQVLVGIFQKHLVQHLVVISETVGRAVNLALIYFFLRQGLALPWFVSALLAANFVIFILSLNFAKRYEKFGVAFDISFWKQILRATWPLAFSVILNLLYFKTDTIILSILKTPQEVGVYSLPYKLLEGLLAFPAMFVGLVMPLLSASAFVTWEKFKNILQRSFDALLLMAVPVLIAVLFFANPIVNLIAGEQEYLHSPAVLKILIFAAAVIFLGTLFGYAVVAVNQQKAMIKGYLLAAVAGLVLYFLLIPPFSYWGAAIGTVATEIIVAIYAYILVRNASGQKISWKIVLPILPAALVLITFFQFVDIFWVAEVIAGVIIYTAILILTKAVPLDFVKEILFIPKSHVSIHQPPHEP